MKALASFVLANMWILRVNAFKVIASDTRKGETTYFLYNFTDEKYDVEDEYTLEHLSELRPVAGQHSGTQLKQGKHMADKTIDKMADVFLRDCSDVTFDRILSEARRSKQSVKTVARRRFTNLFRNYKMRLSA